MRFRISEVPFRMISVVRFDPWQYDYTDLWLVATVQCRIRLRTNGAVCRSTIGSPNWCGLIHTLAPDTPSCSQALVVVPVVILSGPHSWPCKTHRRQTPSSLTTSSPDFRLVRNTSDSRVLFKSGLMRHARFVVTRLAGWDLTVTSVSYGRLLILVAVVAYSLHHAV